MDRICAWRQLKVISRGLLILLVFVFIYCKNIMLAAHIIILDMQTKGIKIYMRKYKMPDLFWCSKICLIKLLVTPTYKTGLEVLAKI